MGRNKAKHEKKKSDVDYFSEIADGVDDMKLVETMEEVKIVPTISPAYNRASGIGGHPLGCITLIHGPNQVGKSVFAMMLAESLRRRGHPSFIMDTEFAGEKEWYSAITPKSGFKYIADLNEMEQDIRKMIANLKASKKAKKIPKEIGAVFVVDTITELVPAEVLEKIDKKGVEKMYPQQAQFISLWNKWLVPNLFRTNSIMIMVSQERVKLNPLFGDKDYNLPGGMSIRYNNRMCVRVTSSKRITVGTNEKKKVVGMRISAGVENNKIVGTTFERFFMVTANGRGDVPKGLDLVGEAIEEGKEHGVLKKKSNCIDIRFGGKRWKKIKGGWADLRDRLVKDVNLLAEFVEMLDARTVKGIYSKGDRGGSQSIKGAMRAEVA